MNELALFAGAGGGLLASQQLGLRTRCAVEVDPFCQCLLIKRQNTGQLKHPFPLWDDIRTFDGTRWAGCIDVVSGGFPCQAFSTAAHGHNTAVDLWPEMLRVVKETCPRVVFAENVSRKAIEKAGNDLCSLEFNAKALALSAKDLGADHTRKRYWLFAYTNDSGELLRRFHAETPFRPSLQKGVWEGFPGESRVSDGVAYRVDRLRATGNGQVPIVAATAFYTLSLEALH